MSLEHRRDRMIRLGVACVLAGAAIGCGKPPSADEPFAEFNKRLVEYAALHKRLADSAGTLDETKNQTDIALRAAALAKAIVAARADAKQGDLFTPETATAITTLIKKEYASRTPAVRETREDTQDELPDFAPKVNEPYPTAHPLATFPPDLLPLLPRLPEPLEYRIVTHYLILRDIESNLIIDFVPHAVP